MIKKKIKVWLALDPETRRVALQDQEFGEESFPPGMRGASWPVRQGSMDSDTYNRIMRCDLSDSEVDKIHRDLWTKSGKTAWPES